MSTAHIFVNKVAPFCRVKEPVASSNALTVNQASSGHIRKIEVMHEAAAARQRTCVSPPVVLTIAGSDSGGGAGVQADLKTFAACGVFGCSAISALTAQNTHGVSGIFNIPEAFLRQQLDAVLNDLPVSVVKTGVLPDVQVNVS